MVIDKVSKGNYIVRTIEFADKIQRIKVEGQQLEKDGEKLFSTEKYESALSKMAKAMECYKNLNEFNPQLSTEKQDSIKKKIEIIELLKKGDSEFQNHEFKKAFISYKQADEIIIQTKKKENLSNYSHRVKLKIERTESHLTQTPEVVDESLMLAMLLKDPNLVKIGKTVESINKAIAAAERRIAMKPNIEKALESLGMKKEPFITAFTDLADKIFLEKDGLA